MLAVRIAVVPEVADVAAGLDLIARVGFYLAHLDPGEIVVPVADEALSAELGEAVANISDSSALLADLDPIVVERVGRIAPALRFVERAAALDGGDPAGGGAAVVHADIVLAWDEDAVERHPWAGLIAARRAQGTRPYWSVDKRRKRLEGSIYIEAAYRASERLDELVATNRAKFHDLYLRLGTHERAYVFGTGPSVDRFGEFDFSDGLGIVCNTIVLDHELLDHVRPRLLAFADPLFHFGVSRYAAEFRAAAVVAAEKYDLTIVLPLKYYELFVSLVPQLEERTIGVPMDQAPANLDLLADFRVHSYANVLTLLMLPLAVTFARRVGIVGCDGRAPEGEDYFWRHNPRTQLLHLIDNVAAVHPAFFEVDYEAYFEDHSTLLEELITRGEMMGVEFSSVTPSYIPALARRASGEGHWREQLRQAYDPDAKFVWLSINPDCEDEFGHYSPYDARVREAAVAAGGDLVTLASRGYRGGDANEGKAAAVFTHHSYAVTRDPPDLFVDSFRAELRAVVAEAAALGLGARIPASFLMYPGSIEHLMVMLEIADEHRDSGLRFLINLFYSHPELHEPAALLERGLNRTSIVLAATRGLRAELGVLAFADTEELRDSLRQGTGESLPLWPMFSTTKLAPVAPQPGRGERPALQVVVYNPGNLQYAKGYDMFADAVVRMREDAARHSIRFVARELVRPGTDRRLLASSEKLRAAGALMLEGTLSDDEYVRHLAAADIIVVPYRRDPFMSRTSAVVSDAMLLGKPIVATKGTWAGRQVNEFGVGVTFVEDDVESLRSAILRVIRDFPAYRERAAEASDAWRRRYSPDRFVAELRAAEEARPTAQPPGLSAAVLGTVGELLAVRDTLAAQVAHAPAAEPAGTEGRGPRPAPGVLRLLAKIGHAVLRPFPRLHGRVQRRYWARYSND